MPESPDAVTFLSCLLRLQRMSYIEANAVLSSIDFHLRNLEEGIIAQYQDKVERARQQRDLAPLHQG
jgi:hypothetical protein